MLRNNELAKKRTMEVDLTNCNYRPLANGGAVVSEKLSEYGDGLRLQLRDFIRCAGVQNRQDRQSLKNSFGRCRCLENVIASSPGERRLDARSGAASGVEAPPLNTLDQRYYPECLSLRF